ncbi:phage tail tape measure protein [Agrobacterium pusense]|uniref:phage tail tape measure protein n=1 Tax=Agrobacterium pusense TaxID=648995 RepID=UPI000884D23D|nr:phage tail tape measure protein [Agrobacterium pusense]OOO15656.1 phage tail tape measure protein [Agrobacterium pusense]WKD47127.1 phage tail tape measure protein [Agrobacterium pusense]SDF16546.1 phage tail tape measure protein, TP901 family, core region [Agrobacterium pusense]
MANRKIRAELEIDGKDSTSPAFRSVATRMGQIERQMSRFNKTASDFDRKVASINRHSAGMQRAAEGVNKAGTILRTGIAGYGAYEVGRAIAGTVKDFAALERQMSRIGLTADASADATKAAFEQAQKLAKDFGYDSVQPAIEGLDTLVASGESLEEALAFLPAVLATAQASGAAVTDIANTAQKASSALGIQSKDLQKAFDIMVTGGKAGQFELKDMAANIPTLANSFANLGYKGEDGLKRLIAILQTLREDTGSSSQAATQAQNIFSKMFSQETEKNFKGFGVNIRAEIAKAQKAGEGAIEAYVRISRRVMKENPTAKLVDLFADQEFQLGMQSLMTSGESMEKFMNAVNGAQVDGTVFRDLKRVLSDTQASIDKMSSSWEKMKTSLGESIAPAVTPLMDGGVKQLDRYNARQRGMEKRGWGWFKRNVGVISAQEEMDLAYEGGYRDEKFLGEYWASRYGAGRDDPRRPRASTGRQGTPVVIGDFPGGGRGYTNRTLPADAAPVPAPRPREIPRSPSATSDLQRQYMEYGKGRAAGQKISTEVANMDVFRGIREKLERPGDTVIGFDEMAIPSKQQLKDALKIEIASLKDSGQEAGQHVAEGGREAGGAIKEAGESLVSGLLSAVRQLSDVASKLQNIKINATAIGAQGGRALANADTGRTFPPDISKPTGAQ